MRGQFFDVENSESVSFENPKSSQHGKIRKMFVINRVELIAFNETQQVGKLQRQNAVGLQQNLKAFDEVIQIWDLCKHIVPQHQVRTASFGSQLFRQ